MISKPYGLLVEKIPNRMLSLVGKGIALFVLFFLISWRLLDPDFGWHLQAGNYIRAHGIPAHDIFTYTARTFPWIDHEWGNDVIVSLVYGWGGYGLLAVLFGGLWSLALLIAGAQTRFLVLLTAVMAMLPFAGIRTVTWTVLFLALMLNMLVSRRRLIVWYIPLLLVLWANLHGGFIIGLAVLAYFLVRSRRLALVPVLVISILATVLNPYGPRLYVEIARTLFDHSLHFQIIEWQPFSIPLASMGFVCLWGAGFWLLHRKKLSQWLGLGPLLFITALSAARNVPLFVITTIKDLDNYYRGLKEQLPNEHSVLRTLAVRLFGAAIVGWLVFAFSISFLPWQSRYAYYPVQAVAYLQTHHCPGNIFNDYNYGGYLIWQLPNQPIYIDGRMPSWRYSTGDKYFDRYNQVIRSPAAMKAAFSRYNVACVLLSRNLFNNQLLKRLEKSRWEIAIKTPYSELLIRTNRPAEKA